MNFVSFVFLILFAVVLFCRVRFGRKNIEKPYVVVLLIANLVFYAWHVPWYIWLLLLSTAVDFFAARKIATCDSAAARRNFVVLSLVANLGLLAFFKYANFVLDNIGLMLGRISQLDALGPPSKLDIVLPIGISFYTFQSMSYTIDVYRGKLKPVTSFWNFLLYVSFFPQLVAGPIVRAKEFLYQIGRKRRFRRVYLLEGSYLMIRGYFLKVVVADNIAPYVDTYWPTAEKSGGATEFVLVLVILFAVQIFADFAGYSDIARGISYVFGFRLPLNFNCPYIACSFRDFWSRWHITLSQWLRDYLYISLGGNRVSRTRTCLNLLVVMLLGGLWHGAAWTFVVWGAIHGMALVVERMFRLHTDRISWWLRIPWFFVVQATVLAAWAFFRASDVQQGFTLIRNVFGDGIRGNVFFMLPGLAFTIPVVAIHVRSFLVENGWVRRPDAVERGFWAGLMLYGILTWYGTSNAFIYFQF